MRRNRLRLLGAGLLTLAAFCWEEPERADAAFPGTNGRIAVGVNPYDRNQPDRIDTFDLGGGTPVSEARDTGQLQSFEYSADGTKLLGYYGDRSNPAIGPGMYTATPPAPELTRVVDGLSQYPAHFLPDGRIVYQLGQSLRVVTAGAPPTTLPGILPQSTYDFHVAPDGKSIYYSTAGWETTSDQIRRMDLITGTWETIYERPRKLSDFPTALVLDVSPDGTQLLLMIETTADISGGDGLAPGALFILPTTGGTPRQLPTTAGSRPGGVFSPDGTMVAYAGTHERHDAGEDSGEIEIHVIGVDGSGDRRITTYPQPSQNGLTGIAWQPGPPLAVSLEGEQLVGDLVELDLTLQNVSEAPFANLRYDEGGVQGLVLNTELYSPDFRAVFSVLGGPTPPLLAELAPKARTAHQYLLGIDRPGNLQVRAKVYGTSAKTGEIAVERTTYVVARNRDLPPWEEAVTVAGGYATVHGELQEPFEETYDKTWKVIRDAIRSTAPKGEVRAMSNATPFERGLAETFGVPEDSFAFLPNDPATARAAMAAFAKAEKQAMGDVLVRKLGGAYDFTLKTPWEFWSAHLTGDPATTVPVGTQLYDEGAYWGNKSLDAVTPYAVGAYNFATSKTKQHDFDQAVGGAIVSVETKLNAIAKVAPAKAKAIVRMMEEDPVKACSMLGTAYGTVKGEAAFVAAEAMFAPSKAGVARGIKNTGGRLAKLFGGVGIDDATRTLDNIVDAGKAADTLPTVAKLGMPDRDVSRWSGIVGQLEQTAKKHGVDVDVQLSFRPRNYWSSLIEDGVGKNMFVKKIKAGSEIDLLLGMDASGLGKAAVYNPKLPKNLASYPADMRAKLLERTKEMRAGYTEWFDPKSYVGKAQRKAGVTASDAIKGNTTAKIKMKLSGKETNGTITVHYDELVVDGRTIVKRGSKARPMVSDYDGNAVLQVSGKELPPSVRGLLELEVMRLQREAAVTRDGISGMATSFHGFTKNGFDISEGVYRRTFKFLLEGLPDDQAAKLVEQYLAKYGPEARELLGDYKTGDYVIQVTRDGAAANQGF